MKLILKKNILKLKHPFTISRGTRTHVSSLIVELQDGMFSGYGEATANPYYHTTIGDFENKMLLEKEYIEKFDEDSPKAYWEYLQSRFHEFPFLLCALDEAFNDLCARKKGKSLISEWNLDPNKAPLSSYTIGIDTIANMKSKMLEIDFPIYKIKLGTPDDIRIVTELRKISKAVFRIDANCGWDETETLHNAIALKKLGVEFIEQPLERENLKGAAHVFNHSCLPIIADESCISEGDVEACFERFHGVNIKLMKCGGLTPARRMISHAKKLGLKTMLGCMTESSVGISAVAQLAPLVDFADMDGALLIVNDTAEGVRIEKGKINYSNVHGSGVTLL